MLLALGVGPLVCVAVWLGVATVEQVSGWASPWPPFMVAGALALLAMFAAARWGER